MQPRLHSLSLGGKRDSNSPNSPDHNSCKITGITTIASASSQTTPTTKSLEKVVLFSPPGSEEEEEEEGEEHWGHGLRQLDLAGLESLQDSASMVAFSLSTPTKEDPRDFHHALCLSPSRDSD